MATATKTKNYDDLTKDELYELAQERDIDGRSQMDRDELQQALELADTGPDAVALLETQHERFRALFAEFRGLAKRPSQKKQDLVRTMITELVKHAEIEEQVFYPAVREEVDGVADLVDEDLEEHHAVELLMDELDKMSAEATRYDAKVTVLIENVEHHMEEEETELFPEVRTQLTEERRRELGGAMEKLWKVAPSRPHPASPDTPPANTAIGLPSAAIDLGVNALRYARKKIARG
ncbi:MAG: hemerythrin domain-containing protein [Actinobacteria bacterium]|nr:hemerythrin domain-containing protein [Actinomycetota bacterium]